MQGAAGRAIVRPATLRRHATGLPLAGGRLPAVPAVLPTATAPRISFSAADVWHARLRSVRKGTTAVWC